MTDKEDRKTEVYEQPVAGVLLSRVWRQAARERRAIVLVRLAMVGASGDPISHARFEAAVAGTVRRPLDFVERRGYGDYLLVFYDVGSTFAERLAPSLQSRLADQSIGLRAICGAVVCRPEEIHHFDEALAAVDVALVDARASKEQTITRKYPQ